MRPPKSRQRSTALAVIEPTGTEIALPAELIGKAKGYASKARSERTLQEYAKQWKKFDHWCAQHGRDPLPCQPDTLAVYLTCLADGQAARKPYAGVGRRWADNHKASVNSFGVAIAAIKFRHKTKGWDLNTDHPDIQNVIGGIRREKALVQTTRRVRALTADFLRDILDMLRPDVVREARDAAVLAIMFAAALRRSEVVGLDWYRLGIAPDKKRLGYVKQDDDGLTVVLMRSKASQDTAEEVVVPADYAGPVIRAVEAWVALGGVAKGSPLFRGIQCSGDARSINPQSGLQGVHWNNNAQKWRAQSRKDGKAVHIGFFTDLAEAQAAYCKQTKTRPQKPNVGQVLLKRMDTTTVAYMVKRRIKQLLQAQNKRRGLKRLTPEEIDARVSEFSGHSLRAGSITTMIEAGVSNHNVKQISRHKSDSMLSTYHRPVDKKKNWGLKGLL